MTGYNTHIGNSSVQKSGELLFFFFCEILNQQGFDAENGLMHGLKAFLSFGLDENALAPAIFRIRIQLNEPFLLQPGQKTGYCGMAQMEFSLNIPGTGRFLLIGKESHNPALGGSEIHFLQGGGHGLVSTPMQDTDIMAVFVVQNNHLLKRSLLRIYFSTTAIWMQ